MKVKTYVRQWSMIGEKECRGGWRESVWGYIPSSDRVNTWRAWEKTSHRYWKQGAPHGGTSECTGPNVSGCQGGRGRHSNGDSSGRWHQKVTLGEAEWQGTGCGANMDLDFYSETGGHQGNLNVRVASSDLHFKRIALGDTSRKGWTALRKGVRQERDKEENQDTVLDN